MAIDTNLLAVISVTANDVNKKYSRKHLQILTQKNYSSQIRHPLDFSAQLKFTDTIINLRHGTYVNVHYAHACSYCHVILASYRILLRTASYSPQLHIAQTLEPMDIIRITLTAILDKCIKIAVTYVASYHHATSSSLVRTSLLEFKGIPDPSLSLSDALQQY